MMMGLRTLASSSYRAMSNVLRLTMHQPIANAGQVRRAHDHGPPQPFDNLPFRVHSRYALTVVFGFFFGIGLWAPYIIVWYQMAKKTL